ncbi:MAG: leucine-rich repeat protein [Clostridia bacterium]|nr:leucine-rich repeat protein [Clostridia bacterium]
MQKKSNFKNVLSVLLAVMMILTSVPFSLAADSQLGYTASKDGDYYTVSSCAPFATGNITVPSTYNGKPVLKILKGAFNKCYYINSIEVSEGITEIETEAVKDCDSLFSITIAKSVKTIGEKAFGFDSDGNAINGFAVNGYANSAAAEYAKANGFSFTNICKHESFELSNVIKATCTEDGYSGDKVCKDCGEVLENGETVPMTGHNYVDVVTDPTCAEKGFTTHTCSVCGDNYVDSYVDAKDHTPAQAVKENEIPATCKAEGSYDSVVYCSVCDTEISREKVTVEKLDHTFGEWDILQNATCTEAGKETGKCIVCGHIEIREIKALGHAFGEWEVVTPATCTEKGLEKRVCENDASHVEEKDIEATGHTPETVGAKDATCTEDGYTGDSVCKTCNATLETGKVITAKGHTPAQAVKENEVPATCTSKGSYDSVVYCSVCDTEISREKVTVEKLAHTEEILPAVPATCTETGLTEGKKCSVCGEVLVPQNEVPMADHTFGDWEIAKEATCTEKGELTRTCSVCKKTETAPIAAKKHTAGVPVKENEISATCKEEGSYDSVVYCSVCKAELNREKRTVPKTDLHTPSEAVKENEVPATCKAEGSYDSVVYCSVCKTELSRKNVKTDKLAHTEEILPAVPATCTETGLTEGKKCSVCGEILVSQNEVQMTAHTFGEWKITTPATCKNEGEKTRTCTVCEKVTETEKIAVNPENHAGGTETKNEIVPTCKEGYTGDTYCLGCGKLIATGSNVKNPEKHDGGTEIRGTKAATCTEEGYTGDTYCLGCGKLIATGSSSRKTDHDFGEWEIVTASTCTEEGLEKRVCKNDETHVEERTISAKGHTSETVGAKDATCTEDGYTGDSVCKTCNATLETGKVIAAKGHVDEDGDSVCDVCKKELSPETPEAPCDCACHQKGFKKLWFKICLFFQMLFDKNRVCKCGVWHY